MPSNLDAIVEGIAAQLRTITQLANVITYEPDQAGPLPMVFLDMESWDYPPKAMGELTVGWDIVGYLVLAPITGKASAAATLARQLIPLVIDVLGHDLDAHEALADGQVLLTEGARGHRLIGGTWYYARRLVFRATEFFPYDAAL
jgi:hypothetical protein